MARANSPRRIKPNTGASGSAAILFNAGVMCGEECVHRAVFMGRADDAEARRQRQKARCLV